MKAKPIILTPWQLRAAVDGRLGLIVVPVEPQPTMHLLGYEECLMHHVRQGIWQSGPPMAGNCRFKPRDTIYVRETWSKHKCAENKIYAPGDGHMWGSPIYKIESPLLCQECEGFLKWKPSVTMPRWAAKRFFTVQDVAVKRVQDVTREDMRACGCTLPPSPYYPHAEDRSELHSQFAYLWDKAHAKKHPWSSNPWAWFVKVGQAERPEGWK